MGIDQSYFKPFRIFHILDGETKCCELSTIKVYKPFEIIEENGRMKQVHIILSGNCTVMQYLKTRVANNKINLFSPASRLTNHPSTSMDMCQAKCYFVEIGSLSVGSVIGLDERPEHRAIIANDNYVQCLLIPRYWLIQKPQNAGNVWERAKIYIEYTLPAHPHLFKQLLTEAKWKRYKKHVIQHSAHLKSIVNSTKIIDIPIYCRLIDDF